MLRNVAYGGPMGKLSSADAARRLRVSRRTVTNWIRAGHLPADKLPGPLGAYIIESEDLEALVADIYSRAPKPTSCPDCGEPGALPGHMECPTPRDHP